LSLITGSSFAFDIKRSFHRRVRGGAMPHEDNPARLDPGNAAHVRRHHQWEPLRLK
jgi:hypothetical protein